MSKDKTDIKPGVYKHYKGHEYIVIDEAEHTETKEKLVVYHSHEGKHWARPLKNFIEEVEVDGEKKPRFEFVAESKNEFQEKYMRALAENQNLLKQTAKEKDEFRQFAQMRFLDQILPVYDNLKMSLVHAGDEKSNWMQGVEYVVKQFADTLKQMGVDEIEAAGKKFDHNEMEAVNEEITDNEKLDGMVAKQLNCGYKLNDRVIRPARVAVYKLNEQ